MHTSYTHDKKFGTFSPPQCQLISVTLTVHVPLGLFDMFSSSHMQEVRRVAK